MNKDLLTYLNPAVNIVTDIILAVVPLFLLRNLQIPRRQRFILLGVFAVGFFACITSIIRLNALYQIANAADDAETQSSTSIVLVSPTPSIRRCDEFSCPSKTRG